MDKPKSILQVEDDDNDVMFLKLALESAGVTVPLRIAVDGQEAIDYLSGTAPFTDRQAYPDPSLVLLDLRIPKIPGLEVLKWIRKQPALKKIPVLVLTSSDAKRDIEDAYRLGANSYFVKPINPPDLLEIVKHIRDYWLKPSRKKLEVPDSLSRFLKRPMVETIR